MHYIYFKSQNRNSMFAVFEQKWNCKNIEWELWSYKQFNFELTEVR